MGSNTAILVNYPLVPIKGGECPINNTNNNKSQGECPVNHNNNNNNIPSNTGACPVNHNNNNNNNNNNNDNNKSQGECPVNHNKSNTTEGCPINHNAPPAPTNSAPSHGAESTSLVPTNQMPPPNQQPHADQRAPLPIQRLKSSIPKADGNNWEYPSEQMFYNALKRKVHFSFLIQIQINNINNIIK